MIRVAINGYGRIGRIVHRQLLTCFADRAQVVAVNASSDARMRAYLLKYDSLHGTFDGDVGIEGDDMTVNGSLVKVVRSPKPRQCPWKALKIDVVVESSGKFRSRALSESHLEAGANRVVITAPPKDDLPMIVRGVNDADLTAAVRVFSAASCTTNCIAPIVKVVDDHMGIAHGLVCTTHAYTSSQNLLDNRTDSSKLRIARAASLSIIPSTTGAVKSCGTLFPHLKGKLDGMALRIPVPTVSAAYLALEVKRPTTTKEVNDVLRQSASSTLRGILGYEEELLVSMDYKSDSRSSIVDADSTTVVDGTGVQVLSWYDNEWGYAMRVTELLVRAGELA